MSQIECPCGKEIPIADSYRRDAGGRKLKKPLCRECHEQSVRQGSKVYSPKGGRIPSELRR